MTAHHIALILHDFSTGGSERIAIRLANRWAQQGRRVTLLCGTEQGAARSLVSPKVRVEACRIETVRSPWSRILLAFRLATLVRRHCPDIVFAPGNFHLMVMAIMARMHFKTRPAFICKLSNPVGFSFPLPIARGLLRWMAGQAARPLNALVAMSPALLEQARAVFSDAFIVPIGEPILEDDDKAPVGNSRVGPAPLVVCAGRLCPQKDFMTAVRAFSLLSDLPDVRLLVLGEGPHDRRLRREIARLGIEGQVELAGYVPDIRPYLKKASLFLLTSHYEGYPAVLVEAMASGLPIVTTDCTPAISEIIANPALGTVVRSRTPDEIAVAMKEVITRSASKGGAARNVLDRHRLGPSASTYLALFDAVSR